MEARNQQKDSCDIMAEAILAGEKVKKLSPRKRARPARLPLAILTRLPENFFVSNRPRNASHRNGQHQQPSQLHSQRHGDNTHDSSREAAEYESPGRKSRVTSAKKEPSPVKPALSLPKG